MHWWGSGYRPGIRDATRRDARNAGTGTGNGTGRREEGLSISKWSWKAATSASPATALGALPGEESGGEVGQ